ncbi:MAG: RNB domain-containing ribonuclease [Betaproteobacteria bacterium]|nr:MAG: RNB domain-containing ribonuclease [Betaproteobacteria bacterium]
MHVFFEDDGAFKAGTVLADNDTSLQVEAISGKRLKLKAANVLLRFSGPAPSILLADAQAIAAGIDPDFLWEVCGEAEFGFAELAGEYFGRAPAPSEAAALALRLHASPMHFYKKGKGRYKAAPAEALQAARAGVERKRREMEEVAAYAAELQAHRLPPGFREKLPMLLYKPDKLALETRALAVACEAARTHPLALLAACGAIPSTHDYHFNRFLFDAFPRGTDFPRIDDLPAAPDLPLAAVRAFSIDDASTTEIDDAFSVRSLANGNLEIGIHIAAPALVIARGSPLDAIARARLSTVYMPGRKITMLPETVIGRFTLAANSAPAALSLYVETTHDGVVVRQSTRAERVPIAANLRLDAISECFASDASVSDPEWSDELRALWRLARRLEESRGKADVTRVDYNFLVDWEASPDGRVAIVPRPRGSPLDKLVAELMIHVNSSWGKVLVDAGVPGLYRTQQVGKVRMSTKPEPHQGLGVAQYLWASSPLRRYSDLVNQRQLLAVLDGGAAVYAEGDAELFAIMADFELTYSQYAELQGQMEHYWCLRWLQQENIAESEGTVVRDNLVRFDGIPLYVRAPDMPALTPGTRVRLGVGQIDLLAATVEARFIGAA